MPENTNNNEKKQRLKPSNEAEQIALLQDLIKKTEHDNSSMFIPMKADAYHELGLIMFFRKEHDQAIQHIEKAQKYYSEAKNFPMVSACLADLSWIYYNKRSDNLIRALTLLNDARYLLEHNKHPEIKAKILHYYGLISYRERKFGEALKYFKQAENTAEKNGLELSKIQDSFGVHYSRVGDFQVAIRFLQSSLKKKKQIRNSRELSVTELLLGRIYLRLEDYDHARDYLESAKSISTNLGGSRRVCRLLCELAKIYIYFEEFDKAKNYCEESIRIAKHYEDDMAYSFAHLELTNIFYHEGNYDQIIETLNTKINPIFIQQNSARGIAYSKRIEARTLLAQGKDHKAIEILHESLEIFKEISQVLEVARSHLELSKAYRSIREDRLALSSVREALRIAESEGNNLLIKQIEDEFSYISEDEWLKIIDKRSKNERIHEENTSLLDALSTLSLSGTSENVSAKDPLLSLLHVGQAMAAETDIDKLLITITEETKAALNIDRATVFLFDKNTHELWSKVASGMGQQEIRFPAHLGLAGHVAMTGEVINIEDAYNDSRFNKDIDKKTGYRTRTVMCVPMRNLKHEVTGVFQVINTLSGEPFSAQDEALLIAIGSSAAISIENARLFKEQAQLYQEQKKSFNSFINTLAFSIDARDKITAGHSSRVTSYTLAIADQMNLNSDDKEVLEYAALLHDFGKIGIQDRVLCKEGILTEEEYSEIKRHAFLTKKILGEMEFQEKLKNVPDIASSHHERYDGTGYFRGTKGEEIPLGGRIMAVADVFDAITSKRHYRDRMSMLKVLNILRKDSGSHFDPRIVNIFFKIPFAKIVSIIIDKEDATISEKEYELFNQYSMEEVHTILKKNEYDLTPDEKLLVNTFTLFYERKNQLHR